MTLPAPKTSFAAGEISPSLFGHVDLARFQTGAATMRNFYPGYRGGAYSRAGTEYCAFSKQTGRAYPPRLIPFQFSIEQGLVLEFGHGYMRVIYDGALVTKGELGITGITTATPPRVTAPAVRSVVSANANLGAVAVSYVPGDTVSLAGGTFTTRAVLTVVNTTIAAISVNSGGTSGYAPGDTISLAGGTQTVQSQVVVATTTLNGNVANISLVNAGSGGTPGSYNVEGSTGLGVRFVINITIGGGGTVTSINSIVDGGNYTTNPTNVANEQLVNATAWSGGAAVAARVSIQLVVATISIVNRGSFTVNPPGATMTQGATSGSGSGATFNNVIMGPNVLTVSTAGSYSVIPADPVSQFATSGAGSGATFNVVWTTPVAIANGDWVYISGVGGMTQLNGDTYIAQNVAGNDFDLYDVYGAAVPGATFTPYSGGGIAAPVYTVVTIYNEQDLKWLKFTQSADVMTIDCVNQETGTEYPPQDLARYANDDWAFTTAIDSANVSAPSGLSGTASAAGAVTYQYVVTAVSPDDGTESVASNIGQVASAVNIAATAGTISLTWGPVSGVNVYNVYKATPGISATPPVGALFGFVGQAYGVQFLDTNIVPDFSQVPPLHRNPFARGRILGLTVGSAGTGYTGANVTVNSLTGSGAIIRPIIAGGGVVAFVIDNEGENYSPTDTVTVGGDGSGATATLTVGPQSGTYPGTVGYFQQRRFHGYTTNNPDTYFGSQPGAYTNFDSRIPTIDSDAIIGSPWSVQVNGIQFFTPMPGGLVVFTGANAQLLTGVGGSAFSPQPIGPASQSNQPQAQNGCSPTVPPIRIDSDIVFVQAKGSIYRGIFYQISGNIYGSGDLTVYSTQLFNGYTIREHAWCEEPYKILWAVRSDGNLLSLTYLRSEQVIGWARHDTQGLWKSVSSITELPIDRLYLAAYREFGGRAAYTIERMNSRIWPTTEDCWCVDCGISLPQQTPAATLSANSAVGAGQCTSVSIVSGGTGYSAGSTAQIIDNNGQGPGTGATVTLTINGSGVITAVNVGAVGSGYIYPRVVVTDPLRTGSGFEASVVLNNNAQFDASAAVFSLSDVGKVIRMGGGVATIVIFNSATSVIANISNPIVKVLPNGAVIPAAAGEWTMTAGVTSVSGLRNFAGATFGGLVDGNPMVETVVPSNGVLPLGSNGSSVRVGLPFTAQLQSVYLPKLDEQGNRKKIAAVTVRLEASRRVKVGVNQIDGSTLIPLRTIEEWNYMNLASDKVFTPYNSEFTPIFTGDTRLFVDGGYLTTGQVAVLQENPLPVTVLAMLPEVDYGDTPDAGRRQGGD